MQFLFIDYTNLILKTYEERKDSSQLSQLLVDPTIGNLSKACFNNYVDRSKRGEEEKNTLESFFGVPPTNIPFIDLIKGYPTSRFKPLQKLIKGEIKNPASVNVELLAWLLDFKPRPFGNAQKIFANKNPETTSQSSPVNGGNDNISEDDNCEDGQDEIPFKKSDIISENVSQEGSNKKMFINDETGDPQKNNSQKKLGLAALVSLIIPILLGGLYSLQQHGNFGSMIFGNAGCMYWAEDHYVEVSCNEPPKGRLFLPLDMEKVNSFRRITREDTITEWSIGKIYYIKDNNKIKCYTESGSYPEELNRSLKKLTPRIFDSLQKQLKR